MRKIYEHLNCSGVYGILYKPDDKFHYIGCSKNIKQRWRVHRCCKTGEQYNDDFHLHLRANIDDYECVVLYEYDGVIKDRHDLYEILVPIECAYIREYKALGHPIVTSEENNLHTNKDSDETKAKKSASHKGENNPMKRPEVRAKMTGDNNPSKRPEVREKKREKMTGVPKTNETKAKMSAAKKGKPSNVAGTKWMHKPNSNERPKMVPECDIKQRLAEGYIFGMK